MLAATIEDIGQLRFPLYATPKVDGIRALLLRSKTGKKVLVSRSFKRIPNRHIRETIENSNLPAELDGELIVTDGTFQQTTSGIMSREGKPNFKYLVFDYVGGDLTISYGTRLKSFLFAVSILDMICNTWLSVLWPECINSVQELERCEQKYLAMGYEGVMLRTWDSPYKCGRSTFNEHYLLKLKRFADAEARVLGFTELQHNTNDPELDAFGLTERSASEGEKIGGGILGALIVQDVKTGVIFNIGSGFTLAQRKSIWLNQNATRNKLLTYKYQQHGVKDKPRCPVFKGWRLD